MKGNRAHWANIVVLISLCLVSWQVDAQTNRADDAQVTAMRERIQAIMRQTIKRGETVVVFDGRQVIARTFIPPSNLAVDEVRSYGDKAVPILAEYLQQPNGFEKYHAMRFLGAIGRKSVVEPLRQVALHDSSAAYRECALAFLTEAPWELAAPILREAASRDTDLRVRQRAEELIAGYGPQ